MVSDHERRVVGPVEPDEGSGGSPEGERNPRPHVLVIDDSDVAREQMKRLLEQAGFGVFTLASAIGASRLIQRERVGVVVVDISMPGISGDKLVQMLRRNARTRDLIIMVVSGCRIEEFEIRARCGADEAVAKRELTQALVSAVTRLVCRASAARLKAHPLG